MAETMTKVKHNSDSQEAQEHSEGKVARTYDCMINVKDHKSQCQET